MSLVGTTVGNIRIDAQLGRGGMGEVYQGFDLRLERPVEVKSLRAEQRLSPEQKARFRREARLLSRLGHPSICQIYELIETPGADLLVLELVPGRTLRELMRRREAAPAGDGTGEPELDLERVLRLGEQ